MAEKKEKAVEAQVEETAKTEAPVTSEAQANPEKFLKDFNWHNYEEGIDPVEDSKLEEFEKLVAENFVDTLDDEVVEGEVIHITDRDAIALGISHHLILDLLPTKQTPLDHQLVSHRELQSLATDLPKFVSRLRNPPARSPKRVGRPNNTRIRHLIQNRF